MSERLTEEQIKQAVEGARQQLANCAQQRPGEYPRPVACAVIVRDGKVLLERHAPDGRNTDKYKWDIPGGKVEIGEDPADTVVREIQEEMGVGVRVVNRAAHLLPSVWDNGRGQRHWTLIAYLCEIVSGEPTLSDDLQWIELSRMAEFALEPDVWLITEVLDDRKPQHNGWHVGTHNPKNVWEGERPVCHCETAEDAAQIVAAMKAFSERTA